MINLSIKQIFKQAWQLTKQHLVFLIGLILVFAVLPNILMDVAKTFLQDQILIQNIVSIAVVILQIWLQVGAMKISFAIVDGQKPQFADVVKQGRYMLPFIGVALLVGIVVAALAMLVGVTTGSFSRVAPNAVTGIITAILVVVMVYVIIRLFFSTYFVVDQDMRPVAAIKQSLAVTKGLTLKILVVFIPLIVINFVGTLLTGLGLLITAPFTLMAFTVLYRTLANQNLPAPIVNDPLTAPTPTTL